MGLDHEAIYEAYKSESKPVVSIDDSAGAKDADGKTVVLDDAKVAAARKSLDDAALAIKYKSDRTTNGSTIYASVGDQLDMVYKDLLAGKLDATGTWAKHIKAVKDANPKP
jgi:hypothetical protein|tara:strand:+ start:183 stop:515 length:333 start_codon:yes stop_codon:yes gene_type:complete